MYDEPHLPLVSQACMLHSQGPLSLLKDQSTWGIACSLANMSGPSASPGRRPGIGEASASSYTCTPPFFSMLQL